ncbi:MAG: NUDIX hydrolase [Gemmatimonadetes bacterium]|nr:NUDIX hydrolase [Gemmatimonadota bacterium]
MRPISFSPEREIYRNEFLRLYSVRADFGEFTREYFVADKGRRVGVIVLREGRVLLVRQYRLLIDDMSWELPGGGIKAGETAEQAAVRECGEEAGVLCHSLSKVLEFDQGIDVTKSPALIFKCTDFSVRPGLHNRETDDRKWVPLTECLDMVLDGRIRDSMTMMALLVHARLEERS